MFSSKKHSKMNLYIFNIVFCVKDVPMCLLSLKAGHIFVWIFVRIFVDKAWMVLCRLV